ncbi:hypothetical protein GBAR_LOCUS21157 [Geodia barretti]|uniref:Uncharacterized protein n=1 Tax=Geodia barretti TaxID=519541 RepID=A0AA35SY76_GEOBA|nr:hypothetical protein GBAR_LOCUS21157 [Geodia barretti]
MAEGLQQETFSQRTWKVMKKCYFLNVCILVPYGNIQFSIDYLTWFPTKMSAKLICKRVH